jgi:hypothetical protein
MQEDRRWLPVLEELHAGATPAEALVSKVPLVAVSANIKE